MKSGPRTTALLVLSGLVLATISTFSPYSLKASASGGGYGLLVGTVRPCSAKRFDARPDEPLIMILTRSGETYETYNVSADPGTTAYHFDVPVGRYVISTTWWGSKEYSVSVKFGKTTRVDFNVSCGPFST